MYTCWRELGHEDLLKDYWGHSVTPELQGSQFTPLSSWSEVLLVELPGDDLFE